MCIRDSARTLGLLLQARVSIDARSGRPRVPRMPRSALWNDRAWLCRDEIQPVCGGQIKRIAYQRRTRVEGRIHFDQGQLFLPPPCTQNGHRTLNIANVEPVPGEQQTSPNRPARFVLPDSGACCSVQTMDRPAEVARVQQTVLYDGCSHYAPDFARGPEAPALGN